MKIVPKLDDIRSFGILHTGVLKRIGISQFWFQHVNRQSFL